MEQREDLALVPFDEPRVGALVERRAPELHAVLLAVALDLAVPEHRQARERRHDHRDAEVLVALAELLDGGLLVGVAHEVDVALEDLRVELERVLDELAVALAVLVTEHVHERAVIDAMHAERPHEVALEHPERLGQQERARDLVGDAVDHLAPELGRHPPVELGLGHRVLGARRDPASLAGERPPEPLDVALGEDHRRVEPDDREPSRDRQDRPDDLLADLRLEEVQLRGVVPREARPVVAVIDVARLPGAPVDPLEDHRRVAVVPVVVLEHDLGAVVGREIRTAERVDRIGRLREREEPFRVLQDPARNRCPCGWGPCRSPAGRRGSRPGRARPRRPPRRRGPGRSGSRRASTRRRPRRRCRACA